MSNHLARGLSVMPLVAHIELDSNAKRLMRLVFETLEDIPLGPGFNFGPERRIG